MSRLICRQQADSSRIGKAGMETQGWSVRKKSGWENFFFRRKSLPRISWRKPFPYSSRKRRNWAKFWQKWALWQKSRLCASCHSSWRFLPSTWRSWQSRTTSSLWWIRRSCGSTWWFRLNTRKARQIPCGWPWRTRWMSWPSMTFRLSRTCRSNRFLQPPEWFCRRSTSITEMQKPWSLPKNSRRSWKRNRTKKLKPSTKKSWIPRSSSSSRSWSSRPPGRGLPISTWKPGKIKSVSATASTVRCTNGLPTTWTCFRPSSHESRSSAAWTFPRRGNRRTDVWPWRSTGKNTMSVFRSCRRSTAKKWLCVLPRKRHWRRVSRNSASSRMSWKSSTGSSRTRTALSWQQDRPVPENPRHCIRPFRS